MGVGRLFVVSEHLLFGECLAAALSAFDSRFDVKSVHKCDEINVSSSDIPLVIIVDLHSSPGFRPAKTRQLAQNLPNAHIVVIGRPQNEEDVVAYLEAGAADYRLSNADSVEDLCVSLHQVLQRRVTFAPERARALFARLQELSRQQFCQRDLDASHLTCRELQILGLVDKGKSNKQIANELHVSLHTVKNHVHHILEKLNARNRREVVHLAHGRGWLKTSSHSLKEDANRVTD